MSAGNLLDRLVEKIKNEPEVLWHLVAAVMALGASFGFELTGEQQAAVWGVLQGIAVLVVRGSVTPTRSIPRGPQPTELHPKLTTRRRRQGP